MIKKEETTELPLKIGEKKLVYEDMSRKIHKISAYFKNFEKEYYVSYYGVRAGLVVIDNDKILLSRQYRLVINNLSYEIPGGKVDKEESPEQAAIRECYEETGIRVSSAIPLTKFHSGLDIHDSLTCIYYSDKINNTPIKKSKKYIWIPIKECFQMISNEKIIDNLSIIAILSYISKYKCNNFF